MDLETFDYWQDFDLMAPEHCLAELIVVDYMVQRRGLINAHLSLYE